MTLFEKNWELLYSLFFKGMSYKEIPKAPEPSENLEWRSSRSEELTARYKGAALHSLHNPRKESDRLIAREIQSDTEVVIFCGFGLGYTIESYLRLHPDGKAIILEPDAELFLQVMTRRDLSNIFSNKKSRLLLNCTIETLTEVLKDYKREKFQLLYFRPTYKDHSDYWNTIDETVRKFLSRREINKNTLKKFGKRWVRNLASNLEQFSRSRPLKNLKNSFKGIPALIIAAGPSLENDLKKLQEIREKTILICVDTALRSVLRQGITPDFTLVVDPQFWNSRHLDRLNGGKTLLITDATTYPSVFRHFNPPFFLMPSSFPLSSRMEDTLGITDKLHSGGSVATAAWETARYLGCSQIWCSGLDLGFPDKQTHFKGSFFEERVHGLNTRLNPGENAGWHAYRDGEPFPVAANNGTTVMTDHRLIIYRTWFEERIKRYPEVAVYTLSPGGVSIPSITVKSKDDLLQLSECRKDINEILGNIRERPWKSKNRILKECLSEILNELKLIKKLARDGSTAVNHLETFYRTGKPIQEELKRLDDIDRKLMDTPAREITAFTVQPVMEALSKSSGNIIEDSRKLYITLEQSADFHIRLFSRKLP